jgi:hypothetical protein
MRAELKRHREKVAYSDNLKPSNDANQRVRV